MKIGIVGTRSRNTDKDYSKVLGAFTHLLLDLSQKSTYNSDEIHLISGGCPKGADRFAEIIAREHQIPITIYYAKWEKYGKSAGTKRNQQIAYECDYLIACVSEDRKGGTESTIDFFKDMNPVSYGRRLIIV